MEKFKTTRNALLIGTQVECDRWAKILRKANPSIVLTLTHSEDEAYDALFDYFMYGKEFELVVSNKVFCSRIRINSSPHLESKWLI